MDWIIGFTSWYAVSSVSFSRFPFLRLYGHKKDLLVAQTILKHKHSLPEKILCGYSISALVRARLRVVRSGVCLRKDAGGGNTGVGAAWVAESYLRGAEGKVACSSSRGLPAKKDVQGRRHRGGGSVGSAGAGEDMFSSPMIG